jgi:Carboxypeptidase regulatory-like domain
MKRFALVLLLVVAGASGIRGRARSGPHCPVEVEGSPCPDLPWKGTVIAIDTETGEEFTVATDVDGRFRLPLEPGSYEVSIASESSPPSAKMQTVTVEPGSFTEIVVSVDTGIR